jgi:hypothetical protein
MLTATFLTVVLVEMKGVAIVTCALVASDHIFTDVLTATIVCGALVFVCKKKWSINSARLKW